MTKPTQPTGGDALREAKPNDLPKMARDFLIRRDNRFQRESYMPEAYNELLELLQKATAPPLTKQEWRSDLHVALARAQKLEMALIYLNGMFDDEGNLHEQYEDQLSIALEKADEALKVPLIKQEAETPSDLERATKFLLYLRQGMTTCFEDCCIDEPAALLAAKFAEARGAAPQQELERARKWIAKYLLLDTASRNEKTVPERLEVLAKALAAEFAVIRTASLQQELERAVVKAAIAIRKSEQRERGEIYGDWLANHMALMSTERLAVDALLAAQAGERR